MAGSLASAAAAAAVVDLRQHMLVVEIVGNMALLAQVYP